MTVILDLRSTLAARASPSRALESLAKNAEGLPLAVVVGRDTMPPENTMTNVIAGPLAIPAEAGESFDFGGFGVRWKIDGLTRMDGSLSFIIP